jgi:uncharacterized membrane protein YeiH
MAARSTLVTGTYTTAALVQRQRVPLDNVVGIFRRSLETSAAAPSPLPPAPRPPSPSPPSSVVEDGLPRWPGLSSAPAGLRTLDYFGTLVFASSGCMAAMSCGMDALGGLMVGTVTAVGGGTVRDAIFLRKRPFWTEEVEYLYLSLGAAGATFALWPREDSDDGKHVVPARGFVEDAMQWADAVGVGAFATIGAQNGIRMRMPTLVTILCGVSTATFGGAMRDVLTNKPVRILHSHAELYASTAAVGASAYVMTRAAGAPVWMRIGAGVGSSVAARYASWTYGLRLPTWQLSRSEPNTQVEILRSSANMTPTSVAVTTSVETTSKL